MALMIKTEPVQHTAEWEIKKEEEGGKEKEVKRAWKGEAGRAEESEQGYKGKGMLRG